MKKSVCFVIVISVLIFTGLVTSPVIAQDKNAKAALAPSPSYGAPITLEQARKVAAAAEAASKKSNMNMTIAIVEPTGDLVYFLKMDGAFMKAETAKWARLIKEANIQADRAAGSAFAARHTEKFSTEYSGV